MPARQREALAQFCALINDLRYRAPREPAGRLLDELMRGIGYEAWLTDTLDKRDASRASKSVRDFVDWLSRKGEADNRNLIELTQHIALITMLENRDGEGTDSVRLSTLHAAKGLEFPHVFIVGLEEGILPHREAIDAGDVEEERRLMYVGVTRAQQSLHLSWCQRAQARRRTRILPAVALHRRARAGGPALRRRAADAGRGRAGEGRRQRAPAVAEGVALALDDLPHARLTRSAQQLASPWRLGTGAAVSCVRAPRVPAREQRAVVRKALS